MHNAYVTHSYRLIFDCEGTAWHVSDDHKFSCIATIKNEKALRQTQTYTARALTVDYEIRSRDPGHAHLWVVLWSLRREAPSCMYVPNLKRIALFVQKLLGYPKFRPAAYLFPGAQNRQNLISWRWSLPAPTDPVWWRSMHAISSYHGNRHRPIARSPVAKTPTDRTDYNTLRCYP